VDHRVDGRLEAGAVGRGAKQRAGRRRGPRRPRYSVQNTTQYLAAGVTFCYHAEQRCRLFGWCIRHEGALWST
jgi:hypothetical protein